MKFLELLRSHIEKSRKQYEYANKTPEPWLNLISEYRDLEEDIYKLMKDPNIILTCYRLQEERVPLYKILKYFFINVLNGQSHSDVEDEVKLVKGESK